MNTDYKPVSARGMMITMAVLINAIILYAGFIKSENWYWALLVSAPLLVMVSGRRNKKGRATLRTHLDKRLH